MSPRSGYRWQRSVGALVASVSLACGGSVADDAGLGGQGQGGAPATGGDQGTGGSPTEPPPPTGGVTGTGGRPYVEPECPSEPPPPPYLECDPLEPTGRCGVGYGCYTFVEYPYGTSCSYMQYGAICLSAGSGRQGDFCGDGLGHCSPGYMCVIGAIGGKRCAQVCLPGGDDCEPGLVCGETDVGGYGVCF